MIKKHWRAILRFLYFAFFVAMLGNLVIRPNPWNIVYFEMGPEKFHKSKNDTTKQVGYYEPFIPHTFFEWGSSAYKKYKHGDTIPVFQNGKIVGELKETGNIIHIGETTVVWMKPE